MRLLYADGSDIRLTELVDVPTGDYAILSHTWEQEEVSFQGMSSNDATMKMGFKKIQRCCKRAGEQRITYSWVDTCCIDKASSAELSEAINSMYRWYQEAKVCYVYLADVQSESEIASSKWFTRGWTLQELIAPRNIEFLNKDWEKLGTKESLQDLLARITRISPGVLSGEEDIENVSVAQRMSWAAKRVTTRVEDRAYSLLGIFGINMPLIYGEGQRSFARLQEEILKVVDDQSIFAWRSDDENHGGLLATSPDAFHDSVNVILYNPFSFPAAPMTQSGKGIHLDLRLIATDNPGQGLAILNCIDRARGNYPLAIYLEDLLMTMEQFERIKCAKLEYVDLGKLKYSQYPLRRVCVKQRRPADSKHHSVTKVPNHQRVSSVQTPLASRRRDIRNIVYSVEENREILGSLVAQGDLEMLWWLLTQSNFNAERKDKRGRTLLSEAVEYGDVPIIKMLLARSGMDPDSNDKDDRTPLSFAASAGHVPVIELLLETNQVSIDSRDSIKFTPLAWAVKNNHPEAVKLLLEKGAYVDPQDDRGWTPLAGASSKGYEGIVQILLEKGATPDMATFYHRTALSLAAEGGRERIAQMLLQKGADPRFMDNQGLTPLAWASANGHKMIVQFFLEKGADPGSGVQNPCRTPLSWAADNGHEAVVKQLLEKGADPGPKDKDGRTPLSWAAENGHETVVKQLLEKGADVESEDKDGRTPLSWAAEYGHEAVVKQLLEKGADVESKEYNRRTPLSRAAGRGHGEIVKQLLERGADPKSMDWNGKTSLSWAAEKGHWKIVYQLQGKDKQFNRKTPPQTSRKWHEVVAKLLCRPSRGSSC